MQIHSSAIVDPGAELANDVQVQAFTIIGGSVKIGRGTVVGPHCVITGHTELGENNQIFSGAQIGIMSQDLKHQDDTTGRVVIGDNNIIREFVTISRSTLHDESPFLPTTIGSNCFFMACSHVAHDCVLGDGVIMANSVALAGHVEIHDSVIIGGLTGVHQFVTLGRNAFIGGMTRIGKDAPPYMIVDGAEARCCGPNLVGLQRAGFEKAALGRIKSMYKILYRANLNVTQAVLRIKDEIADSVERETVLSFIKKSRRGLV